MIPSSIQKQMANTIGSDCVMARLRLLNRLVSGIYDEALRPYGIKLTQLTILIVVSKFGLATSLQISRALHMDPSSFSRALTRLKQKQWLHVEPSGEGKMLHIEVTEKGFDMIEKVYPAWETAQEKTLDILGESASEMIVSSGNKHLLEGLTR